MVKIWTEGSMVFCKGPETAKNSMLQRPKRRRLQLEYFWGGDQASQEMARECWVTCLGFILRAVRSYCREFHDLISFLPSLLLVLPRLVYLVYKWKQGVELGGVASEGGGMKGAILSDK